MCDRIYIPSLNGDWDCPLSSAIESTHLENVFVIDCPNVEKSLRITLGEDFLENKYGIIHYSDIVSKFLTNYMDLFENEEIVDQLANGYVKNYFRPLENYNAYVIEMSNAPIGGLFSLESLSSCPSTTCVYDSLKLAIKTKFKSVLDHALHAHHSLFSERDALRITNVCEAMIFLQMHMFP